MLVLGLDDGLPGPLEGVIDFFLREADFLSGDTHALIHFDGRTSLAGVAFKAASKIDCFLDFVVSLFDFIGDETEQFVGNHQRSEHVEERLADLIADVLQLILELVHRLVDDADVCRGLPRHLFGVGFADELVL